MNVLSPVDSGDSVDVECSVQMDAQCFEEHMVWWFGSGPDYGLVWTEKNSSAQCDSSPAPQTCFYTFSKTLKASDSGSLHCAVAACGRVLFGNATKDIVKEEKSSVLITLAVIVALAVSVMCIIVLIYFFVKSGNVEHIGDGRVGDGQTMSLVIYSAQKVQQEQS
uniref:Ig-like domain-containing protein n=1 Tax=Knipowitschia caucasica TaxID=637954 RepID=A0AAV2MHE9_KNICA